MVFNLKTREDRIEYLKFCFNIVGAGFGEEIDASIKNKKCINNFIEGLISADELGDKLIKGEE